MAIGERWIYWRPVDDIGLEQLKLAVEGGEVRADGVVLRQYQGEDFRLQYRLRFDGGWRPRRLEVVALRPGGRTVELVGDGGGGWADGDGERIAALEGCVDVDIEGTPFTNTPAIARLGLAPGESAAIEVAYVRVPDLEVVRGHQRYTCLERGADGGRYLYESLTSSFRAEIRVDADLLVLDYAGQWVRVS